VTEFIFKYEVIRSCHSPLWRTEQDGGKLQSNKQRQKDYKHLSNPRLPLTNRYDMDLLHLISVH